MATYRRATRKQAGSAFRKLFNAIFADLNIPWALKGHAIRLNLALFINQKGLKMKTPNDSLEYFAGQALAGMLAHTKRYQPRNPGANWHEAIAIEAFEIAREMRRELISIRAVEEENSAKSSKFQSKDCCPKCFGTNNIEVHDMQDDVVTKCITTCQKCTSSFIWEFGKYL
jgi:hypothetical protein